MGGGLKQQGFTSHSSGGRKSQIKVPKGQSAKNSHNPEVEDTTRALMPLGVIPNSRHMGFSGQMSYPLSILGETLLKQYPHYYSGIN